MTLSVSIRKILNNHPQNQNAYLLSLAKTSKTHMDECIEFNSKAFPRIPIHKKHKYSI